MSSASTSQASTCEKTVPPITFSGILSSPYEASEANGNFGASVAISGNYIVVGAPGENSGAGNVYVYCALTGALLYPPLVDPYSRPGGQFGYSVSICATCYDETGVSPGNTGVIVVGAPSEVYPGSASDEYSGNAYVFSLSTGTLLNVLQDTDIQPVGNFGISVAASTYNSGNNILPGGTVLIGASGQPVDDDSYAGQVYQYDLQNCEPGSPSTGLPACSPVYPYPDPKPQDDADFGYSIALSSSGAFAVGAPGQAFGDNGGLYITGVVWLFTAKGHTHEISDPQGVTCDCNALFGHSVGITNDFVVAGAWKDNAYILSEDPTCKSGPQVLLAGQAYVYDASNGNQERAGTPPPVPDACPGSLVEPNPVGGGEFGDAVAASLNPPGKDNAGAGTDSIVVGAPNEESNGVVRAGNVYVYAEAKGLGGSSSKEIGVFNNTLTSPNPQSGGEFGASVAVNGSTVVVGAPGEAANDNPSAGNVYVFSPHPMGLADFGLAGTYYASEFQSTASFTSLTVGLGSLDKFNNLMTVQQNIVDWIPQGENEATIPYWVQNIAVINQLGDQFSISAADQIENWFGDNSLIQITKSNIKANLMTGCSDIKYGDYYLCQVESVATEVTLPFVITLTTATGTINANQCGECSKYENDPMIQFSIEVSWDSGSTSIATTFDLVAFLGISNQANPPSFRVGGDANYLDAPSDAETVLGGGGFGSTNVQIQAISGSISMQYVPVGSTTLESIQHAYTVGVDTAETVSGVEMEPVASGVGVPIEGIENVLQLW